MNYRPSGMKIWDTWYLNHNGEVHAFYMQSLAPQSRRSVQEANGIGHAVSRNLLDWKELPVALLPGEAGSGEDLSIFTGCAAEKDGVCYLYYTQRASEDEGRTQRIALATSRDFLHFDKYPGNPVITPDPACLCTREAPARYGIVDCRDLIVVAEPQGQGYVGFYASRRPSEEMPEGAVIACVRSRDLIHWEHVGPVFSTTRHTIVEVPDVFYLEGRWYMTLLVNNDYGSRDLFEEQELVGGTIYAVSDSLLGPYREEADNIVLASRRYNGITCRSVAFSGRRYVLYVMTERAGGIDSGAPAQGRLSSPKEYRVVGGKLRAVYTDLLEEKLGPEQVTPGLLARRQDGFRVLYETPGRWAVADGVVTGQVRTCWSRYQLPLQAATFSFQARIRLSWGAAAGLVFCQQDGYSGYGAILDFKWQKLLFCTMPRMETVDCRAVPLALGQTYHLRVMCYGIHYEVYLDDVLLIQCISYPFQGGHAGLLTDRASAAFEDISFRSLEVEEPETERND